jgi:hypothetical protein
MASPPPKRTMSQFLTPRPATVLTTPADRSNGSVQHTTATPAAPAAKSAGWCSSFTESSTFSAGGSLPCSRQSSAEGASDMAAGELQGVVEADDECAGMLGGPAPR